MNRDDYKYLAEINEYERKRKEKEFASGLAGSALAGSVNHISDNKFFQGVYNTITDTYTGFSSIINSAGDLYINATEDEDIARKYNELRMPEKIGRGFVTTEGNVVAGRYLGELSLGVGVGSSVNMTRELTGKAISKYTQKKLTKSLEKVSEDAIKKASQILVEKPFTKNYFKNIGIETFDQTANAIPYAIRDMSHTSINQYTGKFDTQVNTDPKTFAKALGAEMVGNAMLPYAIGGAIRLKDKFKFDKFIENKFGSKDNGVLNITDNETFGKTLNNDILKAFENVKTDNHGFIFTDKKNIERFDKSANSYAIKFKNEDGSVGFKVKSKILGNIEGKVINGKYIIDLNKSNINKNAYKIAYGKGINATPLIDTLKDPISKITKNTPKNVKHYGTFSNIKVDENGDIVKFYKNGETSGLNEKEAFKIGSTFNWTTNVGLRDDPSSSFRNKTVAQQFLTTDIPNETIARNKNDIPTELAYVQVKKKVVDNLGGVKDTKIKALNKTDKNYETKKKIYDALYEKKEPEGLTESENIEQYSDLKNEVKEAIKVGILDYVAKTKDDTNINNANMIDSITSTAMKILGDTDVNADFLRKELREAVKRSIPDLTKYKDGSKVKVKELNELDVNKIENALSIFDKPKDNTIITEYDIDNLNEHEYIDNSFGIAGSRYELAKKASKTKYTINKKVLQTLIDLKEPIEKFLKNDKLNNSIYDALRFVNKDLADLSNKEISSWYDGLSIEEKNAVNASLKQFVKDIDRAENIYNEYGDIGLHFKTKIDNIGRVYFEGDLHPQSKIGRYLFVTEQQKVDLNNLSQEEINGLKRFYLQHFGYKAHLISDDELDKYFEELEKDLSVDKAKELYEEGFVNKYIYENFKEFTDWLNNNSDGKNFIAYNEIDGINNGIALTKASLGLKDENLGIGSLRQDPNNKFDIYNSFVDNLPIEGLERGDVKTATIAVFNGATDWETTRTLIKSLIGKIRLSVKNNDKAKAYDVIKQDIDNSIREVTQKAFESLGFKGVPSKKQLDTLEKVFELIKEDIEGLSPKEIEDLRLDIKSGGNKKINKILYNLFKDKVTNVEGVVDVKKSEFKAYAKAILKKIDKEIDDYIDVATFDNFLNRKINDISQNILYKGIDLVAIKKLDSVKEAIINTFGNDINEYRKIIQNLGELAHYKFAKDFTAKRFNGSAVHKIIDDLKDVLHLSDEDVINIKSKFEIGSNKNKKEYSIKDIFDAVGETGKMNKDIMNQSFVQEIIPKIPTIYGGANAVMFKGFAGYDSKNKLNFGSPTPIFTIQPMITMNMDSHIMANSFTDGMTSLWDAGIGSPKSVLEFARKANEEIAKMINSDNVTSLFSDFTDKTYKELLDLKNKDKDTIAEYLAIQSLRSRNKKITKKNIESEKQKIKEKFDDIYNYIDNVNKRIKALDEKITENKKQWKDGDVIAQYSDGSKASFVEYRKDVGKVDRETTDGNFVPKHNIDTNILKNIEPEGDTIISFNSSFMHSSKVGSTENPNITFDSNRNVYYENTIELAIGSDTSPESFRKLVHELMHHIFFRNTQTSETSMSRLNQLFDILTVEGRIKDSNKNTIDVATDSEEMSIYILQNLFMNQMIIDNRRKFAKIFGTKDLDVIYESNVIYIDGHRISNLIELKEYINSQFKENVDFLNGFNKDLMELSNRTFDIISSNEKILNWLNGIKDEELKSTLNNETNVVDHLTNSVRIVRDFSDKLTELSIHELIQLDKTKENLLYAVSLKQGFENQLNAEASDLDIRLKEKLSKTGIDNIDRHIGEVITYGLHQFIDIFKKHSITEALNIIRKQIDNSFRDWFNFFKKYNLEQDFYKLEEKISNLAYSDNVSLSHVKAEIKNLIGKSGNLDRLDKLTQQLMNYVERRAVYYKLFGKFKGIDNNLNKVKLKQIESLQSLVHKTLKDIYNNIDNYDNYLDTMTEFINIHNRFRNNTTLYGSNPHISLSNTRLKAVPLKKWKQYKGNMKDVVGYGYIGGKKYIVTTEEKVDFTIGKQEADIIDYNPSSKLSGIYSVKTEKGDIQLNPTALNLNSYPVDVRISTMIRRNFYYKQHKTVGKQLALKAYSILKKSGILITKDEYNRLTDEQKSNYKSIPQDNPLYELGGKLYFHKKYGHNIVGTKGARYDVGFKKLFGNNLGSIISEGVKLIIDLTQALKNTVLVGHLSTYINSYVSNRIIQANYMNPDEIIKYNKQAKIELLKLKKLLKENIRRIEKGQESIDLSQNKLYQAFIHGIASTIRTDAYKLGTVEEALLIQRINQAFGNKYTDTEFGEVMKTLLLDPTSNIGNYLGEIFDNTEMIPKFAMYLWALDKYKDRQLAVKHTLLAFPTYQNIPGVFAGINEFIPFLKYSLNIPKMARFAMNKNTRRALFLNVLAPIGVHNIGWSDDEEKKYEWYYEHGFSNVSGDIMYYSHNLFPFNIPIDFNGQSDGVLDELFLYNVLSNAGFVYDINPITVANY